MFRSASLPLAFFPCLGLKRPYEDGAMDDKDVIKKMKRNLRKGTRRKEREQWQCNYLIVPVN